MYALRFNFSHCGMANNLATFDRGSNFDRLDLFERDTWGKQIEDLTNVAAATAAARIPGIDDADLPQVFFGHSRGGVTALLTASRLGAGGGGHAQPAGVVVAAAPARACSLDEAQKQQLGSVGYLESPSTRTGQMLRIGRRWLREIEREPQAFDPKIATERLACPLLIVHGSSDETVPVRDAHALRAAAGERAEFLVVPDAGHTFNASNPMPWQHVPVATAQMA
jgi:pimeloyl-ACP methyl ester carboxylesterase